MVKNVLCKRTFRSCFSIHIFRDSVPVSKIVRVTFHSHPRDTRRLQYVDLNKPNQKVFKRA